MKVTFISWNNIYCWALLLPNKDWSHWMFGLAFVNCYNFNFLVSFDSSEKNRQFSYSQALIGTMF